jgi:DNA-binding NarL/FixJ family response regulator
MTVRSRWTKRETDVAIKMMEQGYTMTAIGRRLGRNRTSVLARLRAVGYTSEQKKKNRGG